METSLHRQLKQQYAGGGAAQEVRLGKFRIDVVHADHLVEIQHGSLAAIRDKVARLLEHHRVLIVKPILARKLILKLKGRGGAVVAQRWSPKRGTPLDLFDELIYFTRVFPHANLTLEVPLVEVEERRFPGHGRKRRHRHDDHLVEDVRLVNIGQIFRFTTARDLQQLLPPKLPTLFHTGHLAAQLKVPRWLAQRILYCMRKTGGALEMGKQGNARLYKLA